jgi:uncharacterized protein YabE (DUF348 family)
MSKPLHQVAALIVSLLVILGTFCFSFGRLTEKVEVVADNQVKLSERFDRFLEAAGTKVTAQNHLSPAKEKPL